MTAAENRESFAPGRLWSLWEMFERHAYLFYTTCGGLTGLQFLLYKMGEENSSPSQDLINLGINQLVILRRAYILSDMEDKLGPLDRLEQELRRGPSSPSFKAAAVSEQIRHFLLGLRDELEQERYFHVTPSDVPLYVQNEPFGQLVAKKFPKAVEDISEAGKCLALQRSTACVLHLMRVLELAVQAFGKKLKVQIDVKNESWYQILQHVDKGLKLLPSKSPKEKSRKTALAGASISLDHVRIAWRNESMHPKQTYTRQEASDIFSATRVFMDSLARVI